MSDETTTATVDAGASEAGSTPPPATTADTGPVNAQGDPIPVGHDALHPGAAAAERDRVPPPVPSTPDGAGINGRHNHDGTTTAFNVWGCGEGRHLVTVRLFLGSADGDVIRHTFSGDADSFTVNGLPARGIATVTNLQGDGRPQDVGDVTQGEGAEIRFDVEPLDPDAVTPTPDPGAGPAPSTAFSAVPPTAEELEAAQQQAKEDRADGDEATAAVTADQATDLPGGSGAASLSGVDAPKVEPTSDGLPEGAVDSGNPAPEGGSA